MDSDGFFAFLGSSVVCAIALLVLGVVIAAFIAIMRKNQREIQRSEQTYYRVMQGLPDDKQMVFSMQFNNVKKNPTLAVVLALFLGGLGIHKFYLGQVGMGILYLLFSWTFIPSLVAFVEAFFISGQVGKYNEKKAIEIAAMLGGKNLMPITM